MFHACGSASLCRARYCHSIQLQVVFHLCFCLSGGYASGDDTDSELSDSDDERLLQQRTQALLGSDSEGEGEEHGDGESDGSVGSVDMDGSEDDEDDAAEQRRLLQLKADKKARFDSDYDKVKSGANHFIFKRLHISIISIMMYSIIGDETTVHGKNRVCACANRTGTAARVTPARSPCRALSPALHASDSASRVPLSQQSKRNILSAP